MVHRFWCGERPSPNHNLHRKKEGFGNSWSWVGGGGGGGAGGVVVGGRGGGVRGGGVARGGGGGVPCSAARWGGVREELGTGGGGWVKGAPGVGRYTCSGNPPIPQTLDFPTWGTLGKELLGIIHSVPLVKSSKTPLNV